MNRRVLLIVATISLLIFIYAAPVRLLLIALSVVTLPDIPGGRHTQTLLLTLFSVTHALYTLGWRNTLVFFGTSAVISWGFEQAGVATGAIFGPYHYTDALGIKLGHVPLLIPLAWFMMIYPSYVIANLIAGGQPTGSRGGIGRIAWLALLTAAVMTAWDLLVDPVFSGPANLNWVWEQGGPYFGVPLQNYVGWMLTTFTVYLIYRLYERSASPQPAGSVTTTIIAMPLLAYGGMMIATMVGGGPDALKVIGPFAMGIPLAVAASRLWSHPPRIA